MVIRFQRSFTTKVVVVFLNSANFCQHVFSTLAPPSSYTMNLRTLTKVAKVSQTSKLSYEILNENSEKTNFISHKKKTHPKSQHRLGLKLIYSEKATKFCKIFTLLLSSVVPVKSKVKISQNFVAFSEYMNFVWIFFHDLSAFRWQKLFQRKPVLRLGHCGVLYRIQIHQRTTKSLSFLWPF